MARMVLRSRSGFFGGFGNCVFFYRAASRIRFRLHAPALGRRCSAPHLFRGPPVLLLIVLFVFYLSLTIAGQTFLSFQWDILLLEMGFLAIFFAPLQWWSTRGKEAPLSRVGLLLLKLLLFKLMFMSGLVKLTSGDDSWWNLTALDYHYWTQPLPTVFGWWADHGPEWLKHFSTFF